MDTQRRMARMSAHLTWIALLFLLTLFFNQYREQRDNPNAQLVTAGDQSSVVLQADRLGQYHAPGRVNGVVVDMVVDTGATFVSLSDELARELRLKSLGGGYAETANGRVVVQRTQLDSVRLGGLEMRNVDAIITPGIDGKRVLLGMSFLQHLEMIHSGGELLIRVP